MSLPTRYVRRFIHLRSIRKGVLGGDRFWLGVFVAAMLGRQANKILERGEFPVRFSEQLKPGQSLVITHFAPPPKRRRRRRR